MNIIQAQKAARLARRLITIDFTDRSGLQNAWEDIDYQTRIEISEKWEQLIVDAIVETEKGNVNG